LSPSIRHKKSGPTGRLAIFDHDSPRVPRGTWRLPLSAATSQSWHDSQAPIAQARELPWSNIAIQILYMKKPL